MTKKYFCTGCGTQLRAIAQPAHFSSETGEQLYWLLYRCPRWRWWRFWHSRWHDMASSDEREIFTANGIAENTQAN